ncbi:heptaprenyl diphosphate synthase component II [Peribacillus cavernae]|uniref:Heptaprenyl diphosphate synthase component 2 n=1 Tax=Peribacillus cavernae TaxID=1674310 RepID=A0A433HM57_9BACI|nr:heptaprenyl diphosphate synthase component II [Peribacillus cavernae]MDQ0218989.1 heptaprenyl diphosphate synthase [Peribacillus cavernae]RUQ29305.1 heptaprenyl diphosphate synthase component II [Peribacillus cavernae]
MKLNILYSFLNTDLQIIEKELEATIHAESPVLRQASLHLLQSGGKRIRPVFVLLAAKFGQYDIHVVKNAAIALELIHMASLVHDDVIDDSDLRRGAPTIKSKWDNRVAMYTGDYIFARSLEVMSEIKNPLAHQLLAHAIIEVCKGEIEQIKDKYDFGQNLRTYLKRIRRKTALLIASSCQLGAIAAGVEEHVHKQLFRFGYYVGMTYQITDDILDFTGTEKELGKPAGGDLRQGNITLPVLIAMEDPRIMALVGSVHENISKDELTDIIDTINASGAIEKASEMGDAYLKKAFAILETLPPNRAKNTFSEIAKFIGKRKF